MVKVTQAGMRNAIGFHALRHGETKTAFHFGVSTGLAYYWKKKAAFGSAFHGLKHGGIRKQKFTPTRFQEISSFIWCMISFNPFYSFSDIRTKVREVFQQQLSFSWLSRLMKSWRWSVKTASWKQLHKFRLDNLVYYCDFVHWIQNLPRWNNVKVFDECHFCSPDLLKKKGWGPMGQRVQGVNPRSLQETYSLLLMTSVSSNDTVPVFPQLLAHTVTSWDVLEYFVEAVESGFLRPGDIVIMDNARVHSHREMFPVLFHFLRVHDISIKFLPKYSPELSPIELVFNVIKSGIRRRSCRLPIWYLIIQELATITRELIQKEYCCCWDT
jgi:transposase